MLHAERIRDVLREWAVEPALRFRDAWLSWGRFAQCHSTLARLFDTGVPKRVPMHRDRLAAYAADAMSKPGPKGACTIIIASPITTIIGLQLALSWASKPMRGAYGTTEFGEPVAMTTPADRAKWGTAKRGSARAAARCRTGTRFSSSPIRS